MCLATVYVEDNGRKEEVMRDVAWVEPEGCRLKLVSLIGECRLLEAEITSIDLLNSSIILQRAHAAVRQSVSVHRGDAQEGGLL